MTEDATTPERELIADIAYQLSKGHKACVFLEGCPGYPVKDMEVDGRGMVTLHCVDGAVVKSTLRRLVGVRYTKAD